MCQRSDKIEPNAIKKMMEELIDQIPETEWLVKNRTLFLGSCGVVGAIVGGLEAISKTLLDMTDKLNRLEHRVENVVIASGLKDSEHFKALEDR